MKLTLMSAVAAILAVFTSTALHAVDKGKVPAAKVGKDKTGANGHADEFDSLLKQCDTNKDGAVSWDEFSKHQPAGKDPKKSKEWFDKKDINHDGVLTRDEFAPPPNKKK